MKFPIGTSFTHAFFNYQVIGYDISQERPYILKLWDDDENDFDTIEMTEIELYFSVNK